MSPAPTAAESLTLSRGVADAALAHARAEAPNESCGLIAGHRGRNHGVAYHPARNALASPFRFDLHPDDLVRILDEIDAAGLDLVATVHSHPRSPAIPSALDRREARHRVVHLIASLRGDGSELRGWWIEDSACREVCVSVDEAYRASTVPDSASKMTSRPGEPSSPPDR